MPTQEPFALLDCGLVRCATGRVCTTLRELADAIRGAPAPVIEHHTMRCALEDYFELNEFPNDFALWCWSGLGDQVLAESLGLVDPYRFESIDELRGALLNPIEERLWDMDRLAPCQPGRELHLIESRLVAFDTGERVPTPAALAEAITTMTSRSIFYHVREARWRSQGRTDDFSQWLEDFGADPALVASLRAVDFYFLNLNQLRQELLQVFQQHRADPTVLPAVTT